MKTSLQKWFVKSLERSNLTEVAYDYYTALRKAKDYKQKRTLFQKSLRIRKFEYTATGMW